MSTPAPTYNHAVPYKDSYLDAIQIGLEEASGDSDYEALECPPFNPTCCLFCSHSATDFDENLNHMRLAHGFLIPEQDRLLVEEEMFVKYLHLVTVGYNECLFCGSVRNSPEGARQHMTGKNHCRIDISREDSEYRDFYDWEVSEPEQALAKPVVMEDAIRLPTGKILSHRNHTKNPRAVGTATPAQKAKQALPTRKAAGGDAALALSRSSGEDEFGDGMSKRLAKHLYLAQLQLGKMRESDKAMLLQLPLKQQRIMLIKSRRDAEWATKKRTDLFIKVQIRLGQV
ncbi:hypothetical protein NLG97_g6119 [Lecanicillium saksenae]|uniref:Uncharacterized protein n=1 Tax=Lecanicillium saksenae TaxID=468837 RepID=A0ACC1QQP9_9HYPO|nr:hypothetical protein NLG97_g6119 [Lecanicillium saksenae]